MQLVALVFIMCYKFAVCRFNITPGLLEGCQKIVKYLKFYKNVTKMMYYTLYLYLLFKYCICGLMIFELDRST
jgi:hypothetical protein